MRGRKLDNNFISDYISNCASKGIQTFDEIYDQALSEIREIDEKIKEVELLKEFRSKLIDMKIFLDKKQPQIIYDFFAIKNKSLSCKLLTKIKNDECYDNLIKEFLSSDTEEEISFCIKQLVLHKVLKLYKKKKIYLLAEGENFKIFNKFISEHYNFLLK